MGSDQRGSDSPRFPALAGERWERKERPGRVIIRVAQIIGIIGVVGVMSAPMMTPCVDIGGARCGHLFPAAGAATAVEIAVETESATVAASAAVPIRLVIETSLRSKTRIGTSLASVHAGTKKNGPA